MIITVSYKVYSICINLHSITKLKYFYIKSITMFEFLVARLGYQVQISGSPSTFQVACGYWATTKSYTALAFALTFLAVRSFSNVLYATSVDDKMRCLASTNSIIANENAWCEWN